MADGTNIVDLPKLSFPVKTAADTNIQYTLGQLRAQSYAVESYIYALINKLILFTWLKFKFKSMHMFTSQT